MIHDFLAKKTNVYLNISFGGGLAFINSIEMGSLLNSFFLGAVGAGGGWIVQKAMDVAYSKWLVRKRARKINKKK